MSIPLKDYRTSIPESVDVWLDIEALATGRDKAQIGRDVLAAWASEKFHAHKVATKRLQANGMQPELLSTGWCGTYRPHQCPQTESEGVAA